MPGSGLPEPLPRARLALLPPPASPCAGVALLAAATSESCRLGPWLGLPGREPSELLGRPGAGARTLGDAASGAAGRAGTRRLSGRADLRYESGRHGAGSGSSRQPGSPATAAAVSDASWPMNSRSSAARQLPRQWPTAPARAWRWLAEACTWELTRSMIDSIASCTDSSRAASVISTSSASKSAMAEVEPRWSRRVKSAACLAPGVRRLQAGAGGLSPIARAFCGRDGAQAAGARGGGGCGLPRCLPRGDPTRSGRGGQRHFAPGAPLRPTEPAACIARTPPAPHLWR